MLNPGSISFNELKVYCGVSGKRSFFFFIVKCIEKKKKKNCSNVGVYWPIYFRFFFYSIIGFIRLLFLSSLEVLMYSSVKEFRESLYSGSF